MTRPLTDVTDPRDYEPCERCKQPTYLGAQPCLRCWPAVIVTESHLDRGDDLPSKKDLGWQP